MNEHIRSAIDALAKEYEESVILLDSPEFDDAFVGISEDFRAIYDYDKMVESLTAQDNISMEEAEEFIGYNTLRALPYMGEKAPIILMYGKEALER